MLKNQLQCQTNPTKVCLNPWFHLSSTQKTVGEICLYLYTAGHHLGRFASPPSRVPPLLQMNVVLPPLPSQRGRLWMR